jgi:septal ring factor EnvC (AmiA/AmiB activator)
VSPQKQRTTFAKQQRERARMEKQAEKRKRREGKKTGEEAVPSSSVDEEPLDPNDPYYLAKWFERQASQ